MNSYVICGMLYALTGLYLYVILVRAGLTSLFFVQVYILTCFVILVQSRQFCVCIQMSVIVCLKC